MSFGAKIRDLREARGLSQSKIAELTGVSRNAVSQWEAGVTEPTSRRLNILAKALGVTVEQLIAPPARNRQAVIEAAIRLFDRLGVEDTSIDVVCAAADCTNFDFEAMFRSKEDLVFEAMKLQNIATLERLRRNPAQYGSVAARLKYFLHGLCVLDQAHFNLVAAHHSLSWRWSEANERENSMRSREVLDMIYSILDDAASKGQIAQGNLRAASQLLLSAYIFALRSSRHDRLDPDRFIQSITPQIMIVLSAFGFQDIPGFSEKEDTA